MRDTQQYTLRIIGTQHRQHCNQSFLVNLHLHRQIAFVDFTAPGEQLWEWVEHVGQVNFGRGIGQRQFERRPPILPHLQSNAELGIGQAWTKHKPLSRLLGGPAQTRTSPAIEAV